MWSEVEDDDLLDYIAYYTNELRSGKEREWSETVRLNENYHELVQEARRRGLWPWG